MTPEQSPTQSESHIGPDYDGCAECAPRRTKAQKAIHAAAEAKGWRITMLEWLPIGAMIEMSGREGGWTVYGRRSDGTATADALGYHHGEVVEWIENYWEDADAA